MKHTMSVLVENKPGVLARVAGLFSGRGFNIESLTVGETEDAAVSRMTIVVGGDDMILEQISKQLNKLIDTIKVIDMTEKQFINRELALIKVAVNSGNRGEVMQVVNIFRGKIVDISSKTFTVEVTGTDDKINALLELLLPFGIKEMVRTGSVALTREWQKEEPKKR
ncbi:MAG: acetolactate synthase small subunit [Candidatus Firestonebacteria bacterium RIFOXYA2_FULL_40_8]|nr:MAG: acetolactate synthase small subunit [Candidatus Firestonebacteria bacterium RIFOXYA2_FULL_40_8]